MTDLEGTKPEVEEVKPTEPEKEPTVSMKDTPEFRNALDKAVGKGVATIQGRLSISKAAEDAAKAALGVSESIQEETQRALTDLEEKQFAEDPDALKGFRLTKSLELREKKATLREAELKRVAVEQEGYRAAVVLNDKVNELLKQYQVPKKILELCTSEKQMEDIAKDYPEVGAMKPEEKKDKPIFAGAGGGGGSSKKPTLEEVQAATPAEFDKNVKTGKWVV